MIIRERQLIVINSFCYANIYFTSGHWTLLVLEQSRPAEEFAEWYKCGECQGTYGCASCGRADKAYQRAGPISIAFIVLGN